MQAYFLPNSWTLLLKKRVPDYPANRLHDIIKNGRTVKARLLHYFPRPDLVAAKAQGAETKTDNKEETNKDQEEDAGGADDPQSFKSKKRKKMSKKKIADKQNKKTKNGKSAKEIEEESYASWCGWHNDHGSLTGLVPGMFLDAAGKTVSPPDPKAGLYIKNRRGEVIKGTIPPHCLAFQMGESQQIHSGGALQATPHAIRGPEPGLKAADGVSRESFAVFMEPMWGESMDIPNGTTKEQAQKGSSTAFLPKAVPPLSQRWDPSMDFGRFTSETLKCYTVVGSGGFM